MRVDTNHTTAVGEDVLLGKGVALALVSNRNSYFTPARIGAIAQEMHDKGMRMMFVFPDEPEESNFRALNSRARAESRARQAFNGIENRTRRTIAALKLPAPHIVRWSDIRDHEAYLRMYRWINELYAENAEFQNIVRQSTRAILQGKSERSDKPFDHAEEQVNAGVEFLLKEYALLLAAGDVFDETKTASFYHREMPIYEKLLNGDFGKIPTAKDLGIITAEVNEK